MVSATGVKRTLAVMGPDPVLERATPVSAAAAGGVATVVGVMLVTGAAVVVTPGTGRVVVVELTTGVVVVDVFGGACVVTGPGVAGTGTHAVANAAAQASAQVAAVVLLGEGRPRRVAAM